MIQEDREKLKQRKAHAAAAATAATGATAVSPSASSEETKDSPQKKHDKCLIQVNLHYIILYDRFNSF